MSLALSADFTAPVRRTRIPRLPMLVAFIAYAALVAGAWWTISAFVPDAALLHLFGRVIALHNIHHKIFGNAALILLILPSALWLEALVVGWEQSSIRALLKPSATVKSDLACFILDQLHLMGVLGKLMMLGTSMISGAWLRGWIAAKTGFAIDPAGLPLVVQVVLYFHVYSFFDYWVHRLGHHRLFWPLHRYHHSAEEFAVVNATRIHPAGFAGIFLINIPMSLLGATPEAMVWVNVMTVALGFLIHSRIASDFGWVGRYVIQSPLHHRLHHKLDMRQPTGFFGMVPVWDHLFGGWSERNDANVAIGVDTPYAHGWFILRDLMRDYRDFWLGLVGKRTLSPSER